MSGISFPARLSLFQTLPSHTQLLPTSTHPLIQLNTSGQDTRCHIYFPYCLIIVRERETFLSEYADT